MHATSSPLAWIQDRIEKLVKAPDVAGNLGHHGSGSALCARFPRLPGLPAEVAIAGEHGESWLKVLNLLGEAQRQSVEPLEEQSLGAIQALYVRRAYGSQH